MPTKSNGPKTPQALEKSIAKENWFKLVVKIISWKDGNSEKGNSKLWSKITPKEWDDYVKGMIENNATYGKDSVKSTLKITKQKIEKFGGFE